MRILRKGLGVKLSDNFNSSEFDCHGVGCCNSTTIDEKLITYLQNIREHFGQPVTISSAYRCETHNKVVGGATKSKHKDGMAADIAVKNVAPEDVAKYAESIGILGIGLYDWGCHIDTRTTKGFWYSDKQEYRSTFGGSPLATALGEVKAWQQAAINDGFKFPKYGADGAWGSECEAVATKAICKQNGKFWTNRSLTMFIQEFMGIDADGKFGAGTKAAVIEYQKSVGLSADGIVGINTWKAMLGVE